MDLSGSTAASNLRLPPLGGGTAGAGPVLPGRTGAPSQELTGERAASPLMKSLSLPRKSFKTYGVKESGGVHAADGSLVPAKKFPALRLMPAEEISRAVNEEGDVVRTLPSSVQESKSISGSAGDGIARMQERRRTRHNAAVKSFEDNQRELYVFLEDKVLSVGRGLRDGLASLDAEVEAAFRKIENDVALPESDKLWLFHQRKSLEELEARRHALLKSFEADLEDIENERATTIANALQALSVSLMDIGHELPAAILRLLDNYASDLNALVASNKRGHADVVAKLQKTVIAARIKTLVEKWKKADALWRKSKHDAALTAFREEMESPAVRNPPERARALKDMADSRGKRHEESRMPLVRSLTALRPPSLTTHAVANIRTQLEAVNQEDSANVEESIAQASAAEEQAVNSLVTRLETLRLTLHGYGALHEEGHLDELAAQLRQTARLQGNNSPTSLGGASTASASGGTGTFLFTNGRRPSTAGSVSSVGTHGSQQQHKGASGRRSSLAAAFTSSAAAAAASEAARASGVFGGLAPNSGAGGVVPSMSSSINSPSVLLMGSDIVKGLSDGLDDGPVVTTSGQPLEEFLKRAGGLRVELESIITAASGTSIVYENHLFTLEGQIRRVVDSCRLRGALVKAGKEAEEGALRAATEALRTARKEDVPPMLVKLHKLASSLLRVPDLPAGVVRELEEVSDLLGELIEEITEGLQAAGLEVPLPLLKFMQPELYGGTAGASAGHIGSSAGSAVGPGGTARAGGSAASGSIRSGGRAGSARGNNNPAAATGAGALPGSAGSSRQAPGNGNANTATLTSPKSALRGGKSALGSPSPNTRKRSGSASGRSDGSGGSGRKGGRRGSRGGGRGSILSEMTDARSAALARILHFPSIREAQRRLAVVASASELPSAVVVILDKMLAACGVQMKANTAVDAVLDQECRPLLEEREEQGTRLIRESQKAAEGQVRALSSASEKLCIFVAEVAQAIAAHACAQNHADEWVDRGLHDTELKAEDEDAALAARFQETSRRVATAPSLPALDDRFDDALRVLDDCEAHYRTLHKTNGKWADIHPQRVASALRGQRASLCFVFGVVLPEAERYDGKPLVGEIEALVSSLAVANARAIYGEQATKGLLMTTLATKAEQSLAAAAAAASDGGPRSASSASSAAGGNNTLPGVVGCGVVDWTVDGPVEPKLPAAAAAAALEGKTAEGAEEAEAVDVSRFVGSLFYGAASSDGDKVVPPPDSLHWKGMDTTAPPPGFSLRQLYPFLPTVSEAEEEQMKAEEAEREKERAKAAGASAAHAAAIVAGGGATAAERAAEAKAAEEERRRRKEAAAARAYLFTVQHGKGAPATTEVLFHETKGAIPQLQALGLTSLAPDQAAAASTSSAAVDSSVVAAKFVARAPATLLAQYLLDPSATVERLKLQNSIRGLKRKAVEDAAKVEAAKNAQAETLEAAKNKLKALPATLHGALSDKAWDLLLPILKAAAAAAPPPAAPAKGKAPAAAPANAAEITKPAPPKKLAPKDDADIKDAEEAVNNALGAAADAVTAAEEVAKASLEEFESAEKKLAEGSGASSSGASSGRPGSGGPVDPDGQPCVPVISYPADTIAHLLTTLRDDVLTHFHSFAIERSTVVKDLSKARTSVYTAELEERLRQHWPRKGELEVTVRAPRAGQIVAHREKLERFLRSLHGKEVGAGERFEVDYGHARGLLPATMDELEELRKSIPDQQTLASLQGLMARVRHLKNRYESSFNGNTKLLRDTTAAQLAKVKTAANDYVSTCVLFPEQQAQAQAQAQAQGNGHQSALSSTGAGSAGTTGSVASYSAEYDKEEVENIRQEVQAMVGVCEQNAKAREDAVVSLEGDYKETLPRFDEVAAEHERALKALSLREGLGQKYGQPRRVAQEALRTAANASEAAAAAIDDRLKELRQLILAAHDHYHHKNAQQQQGRPGKTASGNLSVVPVSALPAVTADERLAIWAASRVIPLPASELPPEPGSAPAGPAAPAPAPAAPASAGKTDPKAAAKADPKAAAATPAKGGAAAPAAAATPRPEEAAPAAAGPLPADEPYADDGSKLLALSEELPVPDTPLAALPQVPLSVRIRRCVLVLRDLLFARARVLEAFKTKDDLHGPLRKFNLPSVDLADSPFFTPLDAAALVYWGIAAAANEASANSSGKDEASMLVALDTALTMPASGSPFSLSNAKPSPPSAAGPAASPAAMAASAVALPPAYTPVNAASSMQRKAAAPVSLLVATQGFEPGADTRKAIAANATALVAKLNGKTPAAPPAPIPRLPVARELRGAAPGPLVSGFDQLQGEKGAAEISASADVGKGVNVLSSLVPHAQPSKTFMSTVSQLLSQCKDATLELFAAEGQPLTISSDADLPQSLRDFMARERTRASEIREYSMRRLREQVKEAQVLLEQAPFAISFDTLTRSTKDAATLRSASRLYLAGLLSPLEKQRVGHVTRLKAGLGDAREVEGLKMLSAAEEDRIKKAASILEEGRLREEALSTRIAASAAARVIHNLASFCTAAEEVLTVEDLAPLPGDEAAVPEKTNMRKLAKAVKKAGSGLNTVTATGAPALDAAAASTPRKPSAAHLAVANAALGGGDVFNSVTLDENGELVAPPLAEGVTTPYKPVAAASSTPAPAAAAAATTPAGGKGTAAPATARTGTGAPAAAAVPASAGLAGQTAGGDAAAKGVLSPGSAPMPGAAAGVAPRALRNVFAIRKWRGLPLDLPALMRALDLDPSLDSASVAPAFTFGESEDAEESDEEDEGDEEATVEGAAEGAAAASGAGAGAATTAGAIACRYTTWSRHAYKERNKAARFLAFLVHKEAESNLSTLTKAKSDLFTWEKIWKGKLSTLLLAAGIDPEAEKKAAEAAEAKRKADAAAAASASTPASPGSASAAAGGKASPGSAAGGKGSPGSAAAAKKK